MKNESSSSLLFHIAKIEDPRIYTIKRHNLIDILAISICSVIAGADSWYDIEMFGDLNYAWFHKFLERPFGIPSHDTFARVFARINSKRLETIFVEWIQYIRSVSEK